MAELDKQERWYLANMDLAGQVVADVGANVGLLSQFFYDHGARVVSIEPLPDNVEEIAARARDADRGRWAVETCAVSSYIGALQVDIVTTGDGGPNAIVRPGGPIEVACKTLRELVPDATIVKVDVEGHEYDILDQALDEMPAVHTWAVELHLMPSRPLQALWRSFAKAGFTVFAAGQKRGDASGSWHNIEVPPALGWDQIPVAKTRADGSVFKMLHVIAKRKA